MQSPFFSIEWGAESLAASRRQMLEHDPIEVRRPLEAGKMAGFGKQRHARQAEIVEMLRAPLLAALMNGEVDIAICSADDTYVHGRVQLPLLEDEMTVVAHRSHPLLASPERLEPAALAPYPWILPRADEVERHQLEMAFLNAGLPRPDVRIETTSVSVMASIIGTDEGLSYLPRRALAMDRTLHELRSLPVSLPWQPRRVSLFHRESSLELDHIRAVIEAIQGVARQAP